MIYTIDVLSPIGISHQALESLSLFLDAYGSLGEANVYFQNKVSNRAWLTATVEKKKAALVEATQLIDNLNYKGAKSVSTQEHQFPRDGAPVPKNVKLACYLIAYKILEGYDVDTEVKSVAVERRGYGGANTTYNRTFAQEHIMAGIPSYSAWALLQPYLVDPDAVSLCRVS